MQVTLNKYDLSTLGTAEGYFSTSHFCVAKASNLLSR